MRESAARRIKTHRPPQQVFAALCGVPGHVHVKTAKAVHDKSKGGAPKTLACRICKVPPAKKRKGAKPEAIAAKSILQHVPGANVAMQYKLPGSQKPWDILLYTATNRMLIEVDGKSHKIELPKDRAISKRTGTTKEQRSAAFMKVAEECNVPVLRIRAVEAGDCGRMVADMLFSTTNLP